MVQAQLLRGRCKRGTVEIPEENKSKKNTGGVIELKLPVVVNKLPVDKGAVNQGKIETGQSRSQWER